MSKTFPIQVRRYRPDDTFETIKTINRVLYAEQIGNFNPVFCRYDNNKRCLVYSDAGDVSDPFRREEGYSKSFFIKI